jgi:predicted RNA-binding protein with RPS1 domain
VVKNITDYGAFVDLGGIDGLLHVTDMAWRRVNHPTEVLNIGQTVKVQIIKINPETHRISLGMKQLQSDPWDGIGAKYPGRRQVHRPRHQHHRLRRVRRTGAGRRRPDPRLGNELDQEERAPRQDRLHLAGSRRHGARGRSVQAPHLARPQADHGQSVGSLRRKHPVGSTVEGEVKNITEFGLFVGLDGDVDGMVHLSDLDWTKPGEQAIEEFKKGDMVKARFSTSTSRRSASRSASSSCRATRSPSRRRAAQERRRHLRSDRESTTAASKFDRRTAADGLHQAPTCARPQRAAPRAFSVGEKVDARVTSSTRRPARSRRCRSRRWRSPKRRKPSRSTARPTRALRSATSSAPLKALGVGIAGGSFAVGVAYVSRWYPPEKQGTALGIFGAGNVGAAVTKFCAPFVLVAYGWQTTAQIWARRSRDGGHLLAHDKDDPVVSARRAEESRSQRAPGLNFAPLKNVQVWRFSLYYFFVFGAFVALSLWLPRYLIGVYGVDIKTAGMVAAAFSFPAVVFRAYGGHLSDRTARAGHVLDVPGSSRALSAVLSADGLCVRGDDGPMVFDWRWA